MTFSDRNQYNKYLTLQLLEMRVWKRNGGLLTIRPHTTRHPACTHHFLVPRIFPFLIQIQKGHQLWTKKTTVHCSAIRSRRDPATRWWQMATDGIFKAHWPFRQNSTFPELITNSSKEGQLNAALRILDGICHTWKGLITTEWMIYYKRKCDQFVLTQSCLGVWIRFSRKSGQTEIVSLVHLYVELHWALSRAFQSNWNRYK